MEDAFGTSLGWLLAGVFLGWLGNWLFDRLYRRDGPAAGELTALRLEGLGSEIDGLRAELTHLRQAAPAAGSALSLADFSPLAQQAAPLVEAPPEPLPEPQPTVQTAPLTITEPEARAAAAPAPGVAPVEAAAVLAAVAKVVNQIPDEPEAPMARLARLMETQGALPPWSSQEDAAAQARLAALREFQGPGDGAKPAPAA